MVELFNSITKRWNRYHARDNEMNKMTLYRHSDIGFVLRDTLIDLRNFNNVPIINLSYLLA